MNRSAMFTLYNDSKYGITLNLRMPQADCRARRWLDSRVHKGILSCARAMTDDNRLIAS